MTDVVCVNYDKDIAWITIDNPPVNATSTKVRAGLLKAVQSLRDVQYAVIACAGRTFVAGGDMSEFDAQPELPHLPDVLQAIEDSPIPILALMHGTVLGGGFELAMACAWRLAEENTRFGLPEVNIGLIPGAGGTQRLPRLIGMPAAIEVACTGKLLSAPELYELKGLDKVVTGDLKNQAKAFLAVRPKRPTPVSQRLVPEFPQDLIEKQHDALQKRAKGQKSPLENLAALQWALLPFDQAQPKERTRHLELRKTAESRALRHVFFAERRISKPTAIDGVVPRELNHIAVVGGGLMGAGIATACLGGSYRVTVIERDDTAAQTARNRVQNLLDSAVARGKLSPMARDHQLGNLKVSCRYSDVADSDLAIEAVFEDLDVKRTVFQALADVMPTDAILATNTSYIDPRIIFEGISHPERCLGLHFFSPAHIMKLLEIVRLPDTSGPVLAAGFALGKRLRKVGVLSGICDGFIGNRMLAAYRRQSDYMLADGALPHEIDAAMRAFGLPMGPYELQDLTGLQIAWANRKRQAATRPSAQRYIPIADQLCEMGRLGQRSGRGWYRYEPGQRTPLRDPNVEKLIVEYSDQSGIARRPFSPSEISERLVAVLANEGAAILAEGIADTEDAVDMVQIHGYGFPRWRGGLMHYAREVGWDNIQNIMAQVAAESPNSWTIATPPFAKG